MGRATACAPGGRWGGEVRCSVVLGTQRPFPPPASTSPLTQGRPRGPRRGGGGVRRPPWRAGPGGGLPPARPRSAGVAGRLRVPGAVRAGHEAGLRRVLVAHGRGNSPHPAAPRAQPAGPEACDGASQTHGQEGCQADTFPEKGLEPAPRPPVAGTEPGLSSSGNAGHQDPGDATTPLVQPSFL